MNASELVELIRSGVLKLDLVEEIRFRRRTRSNPAGCRFLRLFAGIA